MSHLVLMYHAVVKDQQHLDSLPIEERSYSVYLDEFRKQLDFIVSLGFKKMSDGRLSDDSGNLLELTFDDGHDSFYEIAHPELLKRDLIGHFFITTNLIDERNDFCTFGQLREMHLSGHKIGSHGMTHKFFSEMSEFDARQEFKGALEKLRQEVSSKVNSLSFPGGRYKSSQIRVAETLGYKFLHTSQLGLVNDSAVTLSRMVVKLNTEIDEFKNIITIDKRYYFKIKSVFYAKTIIKKILGDGGYHELYRKFAK